MNNYIQELLRLKDVVVTNLKTFKNEKHINITMERKTYFCPNCNFPTQRVHYYRTQKVKDLEICGFNGVLILKNKENSVSGDGIHIFVKGRIHKNINNQTDCFEMYKSNECIAMTGDVIGACTEVKNEQYKLNLYYEKNAIKETIR